MISYGALTYTQPPRRLATPVASRIVFFFAPLLQEFFVSFSEMDTFLSQNLHFLLWSVGEAEI